MDFIVKSQRTFCLEEKVRDPHCNCHLKIVTLQQVIVRVLFYILAHPRTKRILLIFESQVLMCLRRSFSVQQVVLLKTEEYSRNSIRKAGTADLDTCSTLVDLSRLNESRCLARHLSIYRDMGNQNSKICFRPMMTMFFQGFVSQGFKAYKCYILQQSPYTQRDIQRYTLYRCFWDFLYAIWLCIKLLPDLQAWTQELCQTIAINCWCAVSYIIASV